MSVAGKDIHLFGRSVRRHAADKAKSKAHRARQSYERSYRRLQYVRQFRDLDVIELPSDSARQDRRRTRRVRQRIDERVRPRVIAVIGTGVLIDTRRRPEPEPPLFV